MSITVETVVLVASVVASIAFLATYLKVVRIMKKDGPVKLQVNKRFTGILLDHAERIEETSPYYLAFPLCGFPFMASLFFEDMETEGSKVLYAGWVLRTLVVTLAYKYLFLAGFVTEFAGVAVAMVIQSMVYTTLSMYYFMRYYEVDMTVDFEEGDDE